MVKKIIKGWNWLVEAYSFITCPHYYKACIKFLYPAKECGMCGKVVELSEANFLAMYGEKKYVEWRRTL